ncbi:MAG: hypothetical protein F6K22_04540 [Okeania sp. SIO2F4]|nr:hypothetical protein [Okeania sp. SIO2F4]NES02165.1 hypothetical protein [Okeania sp. SIO2F4]
MWGRTFGVVGAIRESPLRCLYLNLAIALITDLEMAMYYFLLLRYTQ